MRDLIERNRKLILTVLLAVAFVIGVGTMAEDSAIVDEIAHIPAGYSYVAYHDFRLNPEHPPLIKDLAGLPLLLLDVKFPLDHPTWTTDINGQWEAGWHFLYHYGNNADLILFFSRFPILLLSVLFAWAIYFLCRKLFGTEVALLAAFLYALSPSIIAHSHFVTTDLGIAFFTFLALTSLGLFVKTPNTKSLGWATVALAGAHAAKFSSVLLVPFYLGILLIAAFTAKTVPNIHLPGIKKIRNNILKNLYVYACCYLVMMIGSVLLVWAFYYFHTYNFPVEKQIELIRGSLPDPRAAPVRDALIFLTGIGPFQSLAQYLLGVAMVFSRVAGGNTTYFIGEVTNQSFKWYFPVSYMLKEPLALIFLVLLTSLGAIIKWCHTRIRDYFKLAVNFCRSRPLELIYFLFTIYYAGISITGNLNLGIRHLFPILPLIYILVSIGTLNYFRGFATRFGRVTGSAILTLLLMWYGLSSIAAYPHYVGYFNETIGSSQNGYWYFTDSNIDWGQDLKRLVDWTRRHPEIAKLKLDYFGGGEPKYYFCARLHDENGEPVRTSKGYDCTNSVYQEYHVQDGPAVGWIAVSATFLQNAQFYSEKYGQPDYDWLRYQQPYAIIGNSILVYRVIAP